MALNYKKYLLFVVGVACLYPTINAGTALLLGIIIAISIGNPYITEMHKITRHLLAISIIGLGAGMDLSIVVQAGIKGLIYTVISIFLVLALGRFLGRILKSENDISWLITVGTAICGGSAIAAIAPVIKAKDHSISIALAVVFILNALALFIFPWIGHHLQLSQMQFGLWSALAIHDTSSVVGAGMQYGSEALQVGTTVKLTRALWIIPLVFLVQALYNQQNHGLKKVNTDAVTQKLRPQYPWFILGFLAMAALVTWIPVLAPAGMVVETIARRLLVLTLFLIGTGLTREAIRKVGFTPLLQGMILWIVISLISLYAIYTGLIS